MKINNVTDINTGNVLGNVCNVSLISLIVKGKI